MKRIAALLLGVLLLATLTAGAGDPLISRSYLEGDFLQGLVSAVEPRLDASDREIRSSHGLPASGGPGARELMLKEGDILSGPVGTSVVPLGGEVRTSGGPVVDVTEGTALSGGQLLRTGHRYIAAQATDFTITSPAAVLLCEGGGSLTQSLSPDYYAIARALRSVNLFRGSGSGFGEGFDLHQAPTRGEGLVMFLRILGEEEQALACTETHPFTDVPDWLDRYVAWAYARGYANGVSATRFGSAAPISAVEYEEFLLRAMGYSVAGVDNYATSLERALTRELLTKGEYVMLRDGNFLRAHVAYVSYYALEAPLQGGEQTLAQRLTAAGVMTEAQLASARETVLSQRME